MTHQRYTYMIGLALSVMLLGAAPAFAQLGDIPALIRTTVPTGDPDGGRISYAIALGEERELRITVDAGRLVVTISGAVKDQFKIFRVDDGEFTALECLAGFLGALVGNISCRDVESGARLAFVRKDLVDELVPEAAAAEAEVEAGEEEEFVFEEESEAVEEEPSWFDDAVESVTDFFDFGDDEGEVSSDEFFGDEFAFDDENKPSFAEVTEGEKESSWFDDAIAGVTDFFGFGGDEEIVGEAVEGTSDFSAGEEFVVDDATFGVEDGFVFSEGEESVEGELSLAEAPADAEALAGEEERLLPRVWREVKEFTVSVQNKVADAIVKLYVKPLPLTPEAADSSSAEATAGGEEEVFFDDGAEFLEEPSSANATEGKPAAMNDQAPPAATVNQAFQRFINGLSK